MRKGLYITTFILTSAMLFAFSSKKEILVNVTNTNEIAALSEGSVPSGCYEGTSRRHKGFCRILISGGTLHVCDREGNVIARWNIVSDNDGKLSLKSDYNATASASWWKEDGKVYLTFNYETFVHMD